MVIAGLQDIFTTLIAASALLAAIMGIVVLERFFHDKLKELFNDSNYLIFFFLVIGYILYSIGEIALYLIEVVIDKPSFPGISDVYWVGGAFFILVSFMALTFHLIKNNPGSKISTLSIIGIILVALVLFVLFGVTLGTSGHFLNYFYPIMSALIVTFGLSVIFFSSYIGNLSQPLFLFLLASLFILIGDVFYTYTLAESVYGFAGLVADMAYLSGYLLSFIAFVTFRLHIHKLNQ
ncbi:MAG: hypothetical protein ABIH82_05435 [Candidatus Woesearchaeota archaeon]